MLQVTLYLVPPHPDFPVGIVLSEMQGQVSKAVREKRKSDSVLLCCKVQLLWNTQEMREASIGIPCMSGPLFKWFIYRKFSFCGG